MIRDRGRIKWTAMMLPEHLEKLRDWVAEDAYEEKPTLDEWAWQDIQQQLDIAYRTGCEIRVKTWENGVIKDRIGVLKKVNGQLGLIDLEVGQDVRTFSLDAIIGMETMHFS